MIRNGEETRQETEMIQCSNVGFTYVEKTNVCTMLVVIYSAGTEHKLCTMCWGYKMNDISLFPSRDLQSKHCVYNIKYIFLLYIRMNLNNVIYF